MSAEKKSFSADEERLARLVSPAAWNVADRDDYHQGPGVTASITIAQDIFAAGYRPPASPSSKLERSHKGDPHEK